MIRELAQETRTCPHAGGTLKEIGETVSEQLDIAPATIQVIRHIRKKYACDCGHGYLVSYAKRFRPGGQNRGRAYRIDELGPTGAVTVTRPYYTASASHTGRVPVAAKAVAKA